jgi:hypothetical protein
LNTKDIDVLVRSVGDGLQQRKPESEIVKSLVEAGVPRDDAPKLFADLKVAIQRGVQSVIIGADNPPDDPVLLAAYRHGQSALRGAVWSVRLGWLLRLAFVVGAIVLIVWLVVRGR